MLRRAFLKCAAVVAGVAVIGLPKFSSASDEDPESPDCGKTPTMLHGIKACSCAVPHHYHRSGDSLPCHVGAMLR